MVKKLISSDFYRIFQTINYFRQNTRRFIFKLKHPNSKHNISKIKTKVVQFEPFRLEFAAETSQIAKNGDMPVSKLGPIKLILNTQNVKQNGGKKSGDDILSTPKDRPAMSKTYE